MNCVALRFSVVAATWLTQPVCLLELAAEYVICVCILNRWLFFVLFFFSTGPVSFPCTPGWLVDLIWTVWLLDNIRPSEMSTHEGAVKLV